jgi:omega-6 fatty acid desaturase (delta-12 desaturase)
MWPGDKRPRHRNSIWLTNLALAVAVTGICIWQGIPAFLLCNILPAYLAGLAGVWLFFVQHQFEDVYWESGERWSYADAALEGSSYLKLPKVMQFFTGNIGLHHVHHLNARVPNYNLQAAHDENEIFADVPVLTFRDSLRCPRLKLIDPDAGRLLTWREARAVMRATSPKARVIRSWI